MIEDQSIKLFAVETLLDKTPLRPPCLSVGSEKTLTQEVAHPFYLNFGFLIIFGVGLQYVLNDRGIDGDDGLFQTADEEPEVCRRTLPYTSTKPAPDCGPSRANPQRSEAGKRRE